MSRRNDKNQENKQKFDAMFPQRFKGNFANTRWNLQAQMYVKEIETLALSRFTWTGLPNDVDTRFLELILFQQGFALFFLDDRSEKFRATLATFQGNINLYYNPTRFRPYGNGYTYRTLSSKECVPIWDNQLRITEWDIVQIYADRLTRIDQVIDANLENQKIPLIVTCDDSQRLTVANMFKQRQEGQPVILGNTALNSAVMQGIQAFPVEVPFIVDKLQVAKQQVWNECLSFLGIRNSTTEKRERLITDESEANNERVNIYRNGFLKARQQACDQINRMWPDLTVGVDWSAPQDTTDLLPNGAGQ